MCTIKKDNEYLFDDSLSADLDFDLSKLSSFEVMSPKLKAKLASRSSSTDDHDDPNHQKVLEELKKLSFVLANIQRSLDEVPNRVVSAIVTNFNRNDSANATSQSDKKQPVTTTTTITKDYDDFEKFAELGGDIDDTESVYSALSDDVAPVTSSSMSSSSIYRYPGLNTTENSQSIIAAEITKLSQNLLKKKLEKNWISSTSSSSSTKTPSSSCSYNGNDCKKSKLYTHWAERYEASKLGHSGKLRSRMLPLSMSCDKFNWLSSDSLAVTTTTGANGSVSSTQMVPPKYPLYEIPKILPYNSKIDQTIWLK